MSNKQCNLPDYLVAKIRYDRTTGALVVCEKINRSLDVGRELPSQGKYSTIDQIRVSRLRLAWRLCHGVWPSGRVRVKDSSVGLTPSNMVDMLSDSRLDDDGTVTQQHIKTVLRYCWASGLFSWVATSARLAEVGAVAGTIGKNGYVSISVAGKTYYAHRLAMLYVYGFMPEEVDHKNGDPGDNRLDNLRAGTHFLNMQNHREAKSSNKSSGLLGVTLHKKTGRWLAQISLNRKHHPIGMFDTPEEAHEAYLEKKREIHEFCTI